MRRMATSTDYSTPSSQSNKDNSILIVGAGTFGLSAAWYLARAGYTRVKVIDIHPPPSLTSDGYDTSKVVRTESMSPLYSRIAQESLHAWQHLEPFASAGVFHKSGWLFALRDNTPLEKKAAIEKSILNTQAVGQGDSLARLADANAIRKEFPLLAAGEMKAWLGMRNRNTGWVEAKRAMEILAHDAKRLGVQFVSGPSGNARHLRRSISGAGEPVVVGVETEDGTIHYADKVLLTLGVHSEHFLDFEGQLVPSAYVRCLLQLTPEQVEKYKRLPVVETLEQGHLFPPDSSGVLKTCSGLFSPQLRSSSVDGWASFHHDFDGSEDFDYHSADEREQHDEDQKDALELVRECLPSLIDCRIISTKLCHENECFDMNYIISSHPSSPSSLFVATGGSGHAWKNFPILGKYIMMCLENTLPEEHKESWRWRPDLVPSDKMSTRS